MKNRRSRESWVIEENPDNIQKEVIYTMKKDRSLKLWACALVMWLTLALGTLPIRAMAQDADLDGLTDVEESTPFLLNGGRTLNPCPPQVTDRSACLDKNTKDLFLILVTAMDQGENYTNIPENPLEYISSSIAAKGLNIATHEIFPSEVIVGTDRNVTSTEKAIRITESIDTSSGTVLGISNYGTPNGYDLATIYTQRIIKNIDTVCANATQCKDSTGVVRPVLYYKYIKHTIAHESGHMMKLTNKYSSSYGGYHYASGTGNVLDQSVKYTNKNGVVTFYLGTVFTATDQSGAKLK